MSDDDFPEDETDLTAEQMDRLAAGGHSVVLIQPPDEPRFLEPDEYATFDFIQGRVIVNRQNGRGFEGSNT